MPTFFTEEDDYTALARTVTLTPMHPLQCVIVMIEDDSVVEETESLSVSLSLIGVVDRVELSQYNVTIIIIDDDDDGNGLICVF